MSMAPANRASIAEGPALKLVHCTFTCGPIALSNQPFALPTMACACVMLGNAPTRMVVCAPADPAKLSPKRSMKIERLFTRTASDYHGKHAGGFLLLVLSMFVGLGSSRVRFDDQICQGGV